MLEWMILPLKRYAEFSGRSRRKEYWFYVLLQVIVYLVLGAIVFGTGNGFSTLMAANDPNNPFAIYSVFFSGSGFLFTIWWLINLVPAIAVGVRRLHDRDMSGWWYVGFIVASFIPLVNIVSGLAMLIIFLLPGTAGPNRFGPDPKDPAGAQVFS